jgi:peptide methionine sulfoxide reductase msrA/msrB
MDFITSFFIAIASWFGVQSAESVQQTPIDVQQEQSTQEVMEDDLEEVSLETDVAVVEDVEMNEEDDMQEQMQGSTQSQTESLSVTTVPDIQTMIVAGGCFWCVESDLEKLGGVIGVVSGYSGGSAENPTYKNYGSGGHREVVEVTYDANEISFEDILIVTMKTTDPTDDDGTFADRGDKYSSAFYYENTSQKAIIDNLITEVNEYGPYDKPLAIDVEERKVFWAAEDNHQDYYKGTLTKLKYQYYRTASGRDVFIDKYWGANGRTADLPWRNTVSLNSKIYMWSNYQKPSKDELKNQLEAVAFKVTQEDGTERAGTSPLDKIYDDGIYVDILSGEPLYSSKDKFDSGTGWPSFVKPITNDALTLHEDRKLFSVRTETRSAIADNHIGHVFNDGPADRGGLRYCMNGVALQFVPKAEMEENGYGDFLQYI